MTFWSRLADLLSRKRSTPAGSDALSDVRWIPASESPFGVALVDCRVSSQSLIATTQDRKIAESYIALRGSRGEEHRGQVPEDSVSCDCDLQYPHEGETRDGPIFKAQVMEEMWDIYLHDGQLYFARSWTAELAYRATINLSKKGATVTAIEAPKTILEEYRAYPIAVVDYLIRSHLYRLPAPHPLPRSIGDDARQLALYSFAQYGRYGILGTFADTSSLQYSSDEQANGPGVRQVNERA